MTYEECISHLHAELKALGYKMVNRRTMIENVTNFHLDNDCQDCLLRIINVDNVSVIHKIFIQLNGNCAIIKISTM